MAQALSLVQRFPTLRVLVIGDAMLDSYLEGEASRLCREGPVPVVRKTAEHHFPGGGANTAANLRALGAEVVFLSLLGQDRAGRLLREDLTKRGIQTRWLLESDAVSTLHKLRVLADGQYVVRIDDGQLSQENGLEPELQQRQLQGLEESYADCDLVVVSDYCYGVVNAALIERLRQLHQAQPKVLLVDSKALEKFRDLKATIVTPNYAEARQLAQKNQAPDTVTRNEPQTIEVLGKQLASFLQAEYIAITLGQQGVFLVNHQGEAWHLPAYPVVSANDVGAGDSFASATALALAAGGEVVEAAHIGIEAACIAVSKRWTTPVYLHELRQRFLQREDLPEVVEHAKQKELAELAGELEAARQAGQRIVFTNGIFDILHFGHIRLLRQAKMLGDVLVVGINSDASTRRLKGEGRPINNEHERMALVAALDAVDYVLLFDGDTPVDIIRTIRPHVHVKGGDYIDKDLPEAEAVREAGGRIVIIPLEDGKSTSNTIARIAEITQRTRSGTNLVLDEQVRGKVS
jgi:D-beta-D-heptose 7-phosphate kinase/D-beta-D-heptose 1-phosphate adenosyltransferase